MLTPSTSMLTVLVAGMAAGHILMPARAGATLGQRAAFLVLVAAAGALGGWRTGRAFLGRWPGARNGVTAIAGAVIAGAVIALSLAAAGYTIVHG